MTLLPFPGLDVTRAHISQLLISAKNSWLLQEFIPGAEFCTHALAVRGRARAFVACPSNELLMHYKVLLPQSKLNRAVLQLVECVAKSGGTVSQDT
jgi:catechol O-methyltransferase